MTLITGWGAVPPGTTATISLSDQTLGWQSGLPWIGSSASGASTQIPPDEKSTPPRASPKRFPPIVMKLPGAPLESERLQVSPGDNVAQTASSEQKTPGLALQKPPKGDTQKMVGGPWQTQQLSTPAA